MQDYSLPVSNSTSTNKLDSPLSVSTPIPFKTPKRPVLHTNLLPLSTQDISNQIMLAPYSQSPLRFPMTLETCSYAYTLQQKLIATKQKLKRNNYKKKMESKQSVSSKIDKADASKTKKNNFNNKNNELNVIQNQKSPNIKQTKQPKNNCLELDDSLNCSPNKLNDYKSLKKLDSAIEISKLPNNLSIKFKETSPSVQNTKSNKLPSNKPKTSTVKQVLAAAGVTMRKTKPAMTLKTSSPHSSKSVYIDLDSAAEQARLKSTIFQNKDLGEKNASPLPLSPAMFLSSCPGLSITPIVGMNNDNSNRKPNNQPSKSHQIQNPTTTPKNFHFEQLQHLGNNLIITKAEKNGCKKSTPELIIID